MKDLLEALRRPTRVNCGDCMRGLVRDGKLAIVRAPRLGGGRDAAARGIVRTGILQAARANMAKMGRPDEVRSGCSQPYGQRGCFLKLQTPAWPKRGNDGIDPPRLLSKPDNPLRFDPLTHRESIQQCVDDMHFMRFIIPFGWSVVLELIRLAAALGGSAGARADADAL